VPATGLLKPSSRYCRLSPNGCTVMRVSSVCARHSLSSALRDSRPRIQTRWLAIMHRHSRPSTWHDVPTHRSPSHATQSLRGTYPTTFFVSPGHHIYVYGTMSPKPYNGDLSLPALDHRGRRPVFRLPAPQLTPRLYGNTHPFADRVGHLRRWPEAYASRSPLRQARLTMTTTMNIARAAMGRRMGMGLLLLLSRGGRSAHRGVPALAEGSGLQSPHQASSCHGLARRQRALPATPRAPQATLQAQPMDRLKKATRWLWTSPTNLLNHLSRTKFHHHVGQI
jgi:hypothetical protein